ncbi:type II toxin-antitoxin system Phd/YefM family antitoxin [Desulfococcaceae bacterium HSG8]|nr:type II toxin-antitoxin system Phd/YefM family antitoxin [Desulfococcaceae bacterium HSG8]
MEEIQLSDFQNNFYNIIRSVSRSDKPVLIADKGKSLVKIVPVLPSEKNSWLGCMIGTGKIVGDIVSPAEDSDVWEVLSE